MDVLGRVGGSSSESKLNRLRLRDDVGRMVIISSVAKEVSSAAVQKTVIMH